MGTTPQSKEADKIERQPQYAGFWLRFVQFVLDFMFLGIAAIVPVSALGGGGYVLILAVSVVSFSYPESSPLQGTPGMLILRLRVTDLEGNRISFPRALLRYLGRAICSLTMYAGYLTVTFTPRRQGVHDALANTLVLRRPRSWSGES